jgi:predicted hydrocarbon binding protein
LHLQFQAIDFGLLASRVRGDAGQFPERYVAGAFSRKRTSINILAYLEDFHSWEMRDQILRQFQMSEAALRDPNEWINVRFLSDLCEYLSKHGFSESALVAMGSYSLITNFDSNLGIEFRKLQSPSEVIENCFGPLVTLYDRNIDYKIAELHEECAVIEARSNRDVLDALKIREIGNTPYCQVKSGVFSSLVGYLGLPFARVEETSCVHRGDEYCRYEIIYEHAAWQNKRNRFRRSHVGVS